MASTSTAPLTPRTGKAGQIDIFIKITGTHQGWIKGESADAKHKQEIQVESFFWDVKMPVDKTSGLAAGKRQYGDFVFVMHTQSASVLLMNAMVSGEHLKEIVITCRKAGKEQQEYLTYKLTTCIISKFESGYFSDDDVVPHDRVSIAFRGFECTAKAQNPDGTLGGAVMMKDDLAVH